MAAKESAEMVEARRLVLNEGKSAYAAAKQAGITKQAIYMSKWYRDNKAKGK